MEAVGRAPGASVYIAITAAAVLVQGVVLTLMGQPVICECGFVRLWSGVILSPENSQQISDWYTPSHVIHGFLFYFAARLLFPKLSVPAWFAMALAVEVGWELFENSPAVIERYRQQALAQGYVGDSVINSVFDTLAAAFGFLLARTIPVAASIALVIGLEVFTAAMVRDNLTLNVVQLIKPIDFISRWQSDQP